MKKWNRILALFLSFVLVLSLFPTAALAADSVSVSITIHYHREDGNYTDANVEVWNFAGAPGTAGTTETDEFGWKRTYTLNVDNLTDYVKFCISSDSVFPTDVRYLDPAGKTSLEVWLIDGDAKAYGAPKLIDPQWTTARDGVRYVAVQALPVYFPAGGDSVNSYKVTSGTSNNYNTPGANGKPVAPGLGGTAASPKVTLLRNPVKGTNGTTDQQDDWWEITPASKTMMINFYSASVQTNAMTAGPFAKANTGLTDDLRHGDLTPVFLDIDVIQEGTITATDSGKTFLSLATIEGMTQTLAGVVMGEDTYLLPNMFVGYEKVLDYTDHPEALGFSAEKLNLYKEFMQADSDAADGMPFGSSITKDGKRVFAEAVGTEAQFRTTPDGSGGYSAATPIPKDQQIPVTANSLFDLASNTKVYSTNYAIEYLVSKGLLNLDAKLVDMPGWGNFTDSYTKSDSGSFATNANTPKGKDKVTIRLILQHRAGLLPDPQFQNRIVAGDDLYYHLEGDALAKLDRTELIDVLCKVPLGSVPDSMVSGAYSDLDYIVLGILVEQITGKKLDQFLEDIFQNEFGISHTVYNPLKKGFNQDDCVAGPEINGNTRDGRVTYGFLPTDNTTPVYERSYTLQGEVHDEKAYYALGGVAGHAGLFSSVNDMSEVMQVALNGGTYNGYKLFDRAVHKEFTTRTGNTNVGQVGLGWWLNQTSEFTQSRLSGGPSMRAYGHQGWSGTMSMIDPIKGITIAALTSMKHSPTVNGTGNTFSNTDVRIGGFNGWPGPGDLVLQNIFTYGALDLIDHSSREWTLTFDAKDGSEVAAQTILDGNFVTEPLLPTKAGSTFEGWYMDEAFTKAWNFAANRVMSDVTLYAKWNDGDPTPAADWTVIFSHNGSVGIPSVSVADQGTLASLPTPTKAGYVFDGWYTDAPAYGNKLTTSASITADIVAAAKWLELHTITYNTNGGSIVRPVKVADGKRATDVYPTTGAPYSPAKYSSLSTPTPLTFMGWYTDKELINPWNPSTPVTGDMTVYAKWGAKTHSVKFDIRGGSSTAPAVQAVADSGKATKPGDPTKANSVFEGWHTNAGLRTPYDFSAPVTANLVLYAKFITDLGNTTTLAVAAPVAGAQPQTTVAGAGYTGAISWKNGETNAALTGPFEANKVYTATVSLTSNPFPVQTPTSFYRWPATAPTIKVAGKTATGAAVTGGNVTGNILTCSVTFETGGPLDSQAIGIKAPVTNAKPQAAISGRGYTSEIVWTKAEDSSPLSGKFRANTVYKATVTLTSSDGYHWPELAPAVTVNGQTIDDVAVTGGSTTGNKLTFSVTFPATVEPNKPPLPPERPPTAP